MSSVLWMRSGDDMIRWRLQEVKEVSSCQTGLARSSFSPPKAQLDAREFRLAPVLHAEPPAQLWLDVLENRSLMCSPWLSTKFTVLDCQKYLHCHSRDVVARGGGDGTRKRGAESGAECYECASDWWSSRWARAVRNASLGFTFTEASKCTQGHPARGQHPGRPGAAEARCVSTKPYCVFLQSHCTIRSTSRRCHERELLQCVL